MGGSENNVHYRSLIFPGRKFIYLLNGTAYFHISCINPNTSITIGISAVSMSEKSTQWNLFIDTNKRSLCTPWMFFLVTKSSSIFTKIKLWCPEMHLHSLLLDVCLPSSQQASMQYCRVLNETVTSIFQRTVVKRYTTYTLTHYLEFSIALCSKGAICGKALFLA